ncbi:MAG: hypothetical protein IJ348_03715 [Alistipes sp.]|nr:hypothetical protein [Alistipes sp.]
MMCRLLTVALLSVVAVVATPHCVSARRGSRGGDAYVSRHEARAEASMRTIDSLVLSQRYLFRPIVMQNPELGSTRDIYEYDYYVDVASDYLYLCLPVEFVSMNIFTEQFDTSLSHYSLREEGEFRHVLFTLDHGTEEWAVEMVVDVTNARTQLAISTPQGVMRYLGTLSAPEKSAGRADSQ